VSGRHIPAAVRDEVRTRAASRCEYCLVHEDFVIAPHEPDHIIASQHGGATSTNNLALACFHCNRLKGTNIASTDPESGEKVFLFNPRSDIWSEHFRLESASILGRTAVGRTTASLLNFNDPDRMELRATLMKSGRYLA
jgi:hypothetical protein